MNRIFPFAMLFAVAAWACSCNKTTTTNENILYGIWIKGPYAGDTLRFFQKGNKNIMAYNLSFNAALPAPTEREYTFSNDKLSIRTYVSAPEPYLAIKSFVWKQFGKEFEIQGNELFPFMSSILPYFSYRKIQ